MTRRGMIGRLLGTLGLGAAGGGALSGCTDTAPAYAAWQGPPPLEDVRLRLAAWARLAPSSHNLQPWRLRLEGDDALLLHVDPARLHRATDPDARQAVVSQGTFLELYVLAAEAEGLTAEVSLFPDGVFTGPEDMARRPVARVVLREAAEARPSPLFAEATRRRSSKVPFIGRAITDAERRRLADAVAPVPGVTAGFLDRGPAMERLRALVLEGMRAEMRDPAALDELSRVMRLAPAEVLAHRDGIVPLPGPAGWVASLLFGRRSLADPDSFMTRSGLRQMQAWAETATAFVWLTTAGNDRDEQVAAGRAYMRLDLAASAAGVALHPMSQALQEVAAQDVQRAALQELLAPDGRVVQMLARLGHVPEAPPPTPRRPVQSLLADA